MARPDNELHQRLVVLFTPEDRELIQREATKEGMTMSPYVRQIVLSTILKNRKY